MVLLCRERSPWTLVLVGLMSAGAAVYIGDLLPNPQTENHQSQALSVLKFSGLPSESPNLLRTLCISFCAEASIMFLLLENIFAAGVLLSISTFLLAGRLSVLWTGGRRRMATNGRSQVLYLFQQCLFAIFITAIVMTPLLRSGFMATRLHGLFGWGDALRSHKTRSQSTSGGEDTSYVGIILWPPSQKKTEIVLPRPHTNSPGLWTKSEPLVIPFNGPYWYFKAPNREPGPKAHVVRGRPTEANIHSADSQSLLMEAHQYLGTPIDRACCKEIQVAISNADTGPGKIWLGVNLVDSTSLRSRAEPLGEKSIRSSEAPHFSMNRVPVEEVLTFQMPSVPKIRRFDQITVFFFPAAERSHRGAKVSIQRFKLIPR
jgi:hypothetical protein